MFLYTHRLLFGRSHGGSAGAHPSRRSEGLAAVPRESFHHCPLSAGLAGVPGGARKIHSHSLHLTGLLHNCKNDQALIRIKTQFGYASDLRRAAFFLSQLVAHCILYLVGLGPKCKQNGQTTCEETNHIGFQRASMKSAGPRYFPALIIVRRRDCRKHLRPRRRPWTCRATRVEASVQSRFVLSATSDLSTNSWAISALGTTSSQPSGNPKPNGPPTDLSWLTCGTR